MKKGEDTILITGATGQQGGAVARDGAVKSVETAYRLADDLLAAQKSYLPQF